MREILEYGFLFGSLSLMLIDSCWNIAIRDLFRVPSNNAKNLFDLMRLFSTIYL